MGAVCLFETFVPTNQAKHGVVTQKTKYGTSMQPKSQVSFLLTSREIVFILDCWISRYTLQVDLLTLYSNDL
jgi:hypothetical protein